MVAKDGSLRGVLSEKREDEGLTQTGIGKEIGLKRGMISVLERDTDDLKARGPEFVFRFFKAYRFSDHKAKELTRHLFQDVLNVLGQNDLERFRADEKMVYYQVLTSASAGTGEPEIIDGEVAAISVNALRARGVTDQNEHEVMPVKVNGNCLVSQNVRFSDKNVSHGDYVFIHLGAPPKSGDRVCCFDHEAGQLIIKFYSEQQNPNKPDEIVLFDAHGIQHAKNVADISYVGVVFWRVGPL